MRWYVFIHQLPPKPIYLRAKIGQRLGRIGAVALKNSVYLLPRDPECLEDLQWIAQEAVAGGGEAYIGETEFVGLDSSFLVRRFQAERDRDYEALAGEIRDGISTRRRRGSPPRAVDAPLLARAQKRFDEIRSIDFFEAPARRKAEALLRSLEKRVRTVSTPPRPSMPRRNRSSLGKHWVTRRDVHVDRIASAWLVRRFIDPNARFRFVDATDTTRKPGEVRFDIVGGDFTHEADRCTFETILARVGPKNAALVAIGEIVHDIDLKEAKYGREETVGVRRLLDGLIAAHRKDEDRLSRGFGLFDDLYESFARRPRAARR